MSFGTAFESNTRCRFSVTLVRTCVLGSLNRDRSFIRIINQQASLPGNVSSLGETPVPVRLIGVGETSICELCISELQRRSPCNCEAVAAVGDTLAIEFDEL